MPKTDNVSTYGSLMHFKKKKWKKKYFLLLNFDQSYEYNLKLILCWQEINIILYQKYTYTDIFSFLKTEKNHFLKKITRLFNF